MIVFSGKRVESQAYTESEGGGGSSRCAQAEPTLERAGKGKGRGDGSYPFHLFFSSTVRKGREGGPAC